MFFDEFALGQEFMIPPVTINMGKMLSFAQEYDPMPIHMNSGFAKQSKFGVIIAPGIMSFMSVWAQFVTCNIISEQFIAGMSFKVEWFAPVFEHDVLRGVAKITKLTPRNRYNGIVDITITIFNQEGIMVIDTVTEAVIAREINY